jgi:acyl-CoA thioesterase FadM
MVRMRWGFPTIAGVHLLFRTLLQLLLGPRRRRVGVWEVTRTPFRVLPTDLDVNRHMNNGVYFSILDLGRVDFLQRSGLWRAIQSRGWYPVVAAETITFRRSLELWQRFHVETRLTGYGQRSVYIEQRVVVDGEVWAQAHIRGRFLKRRGGVVPMEELVEVTGPAPEDGRMPGWLGAWGESTALPSTKASAPSEW